MFDLEKPSSELILIPASLGELADKITILEIKREKFTDRGKLANVVRELELLCRVLDGQSVRDDAFQSLFNELGDVNRRLWDIEDRIRECERKGQFDGTFIDLARAVYKSNDVRARIKREINTQFGSVLVEEKSYSSY